MNLKIRASVIAAIAFVFSVTVTAILLFIPVMFFAGPHSAVLPAFAQKLALALAWLAVIAIPLYLSSRVYKWYLRRNDWIGPDDEI